MKSAFTLIELLVVMAIIAILAAILFPVFANAKFQALKTASAQNARSIAMSVSLYGGDYDDMYPVLFNGPFVNLQNWDDGHNPQRTDSWALTTRAYAQQLQGHSLYVNPELKDRKKIFDGGPVANNAAPNSYVRQNLWSFYGINYLYLSPMYCEDNTYSNCVASPRSQTEVEDPSFTIELTETEDVRDFGPSPQTSEGGGEITSTAPGALGSLAPCTPGFDCPTIVKFVIGTGSCINGSCFPLAPWNHDIYEQFFDRNQGCNVVRADGSAKYLSKGRMYAGTTHLSSTMSGEFVTDAAHYMWGPTQQVAGGMVLRG